MPIVPAGPARAILQCFAGQAQLAAALNRQGLFAYGVDRVKHKSALAPVLQMIFRLADFSFNFRKLICRAFGEACKAQLNDLFH